MAIAIHFGGPGALFWMWVTAFLGMATKYTEVTLAQHYRTVTGPDHDAKKWEGTVAGGPMYYIERGLGEKWKPLAVIFAILLGVTAFMTGNAIQANTVADSMLTTFGVPTYVTGLITSAVVLSVVVGGIGRIGAVTGILAPVMAAIYVAAALVILAVNWQSVIPSFILIFQEAFNPTAGVAGTGMGVFLVTMMWGVRRGLFSNEAGQGSAPIAHAAAKTDEPVSEGVVALLEPFIDTIVICTLTALVIITTGVWRDRVPTEILLSRRRPVVRGRQRPRRSEPGGRSHRTDRLRGRRVALRPTRRGADRLARGAGGASVRGRGPEPAVHRHGRPGIGHGHRPQRQLGPCAILWTTCLLQRSISPPRPRPITI